MTEIIVPLDRPRSTLLGGPLFSLLKGLWCTETRFAWHVLTPIAGIVLTPLAFLCPVIYARVVQKAYDRATPLPAHPSGTLGQHLLLLVCYYLGLYVLFKLTFAELDSLTFTYMEEAAKSAQLQIGTVEQMRYADSVRTLFSGAGFILLLFFTLILSAALALALGPGIRYGLKAVWVNLPGLAVLFALIVGIFNVVERYFAHYKLKAIEAMILKQDYFDPALPFMLLRWYILTVFLAAIVQVLFMAFGLLPLPFKRRVES